MRDVICNTFPLQCLHQVDLLHLLPDLFGSAQARPAAGQNWPKADDMASTCRI